MNEIGIDGDWKVIPALMVTLRFADGTEKTVPIYEVEVLDDDSAISHPQ